MTDDVNISHSFQYAAPASTADQTAAAVDPALYAAADCERVSMPDGGVLLIHRQSSNQMMVTEVSIALLNSADKKVAELIETVKTLTPLGSAQVLIETTDSKMRFQTYRSKKPFATWVRVHT